MFHLRHGLTTLGVAVACLSASGPAAAQGSAVVQPTLARFEIPIGRDVSSPWRWYDAATPDNDEEYSWQARIEGRPAYWIGFALFKYPGAQPRAGTFADLLRAGQGHLAIGDGNGAQIVRDVKLTLRGAERSLVVELDDPTVIAKIFAARPDRITIESRSPYQPRASVVVTVSYQQF